MNKFVTTLLKAKPDYKTATFMKYTLTKDQLLTLPLLRPPYQADLDDLKVKEMIRSYEKNPEYGHFKNTLVIAVRMSGQKCLYLVDGQHRMDMCKQQPIDYPFQVLFYSISQIARLH